MKQSTWLFSIEVLAFMVSGMLIAYLSYWSILILIIGFRMAHITAKQLIKEHEEEKEFLEKS